MRTASNQERVPRDLRPWIALYVLLSCSPGATTQAAGTNVSHPGDGYPSIQAAVDAAGCGGTVLLAAGTYNERVLLPCTARLIGAGVGQTILDGTNLNDPTGTPVIGMGNHPFALFPVQEDYEVAHLTVRAGPNTTPQGIASGWTRDVNLHDVEVVGFRFGIMVDVSTDNSIHQVTVRGSGAAMGACIRFRELNLFRSQLPGGHMAGHSLHDSTLLDCAAGLEVFNAVGTRVFNNTIARTQIGVRLAGVGQSKLHQNVISQSSLRGIALVNAHDGRIRHNTMCSNAIAIRYGPSAADQFGFGPSSHNEIDHNTFASNGSDIVYEDPLLGLGNTEDQNASGTCP